MNLFLIGYRGTGKSSVARVLARRLGWTALDTDDLIEARAGRTISEIFSAEGEPRFRDREAEVLAQAAALDRHVISLGGGAILRDENRRLVRSAGQVVWLTAPPDVLAQRIAADTASAERRPNLTAAGGITEIIATFHAREPLYGACADFQVDTSGRTPDEVADAILAQVRFPPASP